ncbi:sigma-70 family RNA polymerase sigma factor [Chitinophaga pendula]|uniref:RNA polymerase sigma factor n=1 Tax=Chitinophaga TaxID=79328 RepID=UPI000BB00B2C|nr:MULTISPECIES: sigma-70 family RNA polymerase sigma factor [Chitinophaga]ASZ12140.1 hypothetical protein CK934_14820 [Chitinophaga sp. MD30]UCJ04819.1 sigma-70 family RNA polymerase sigma factor [Chitinophaga pendula]
MKYSQLDSDALLLNVRSGNAAAFSELYGRFWEPFYLFVYRRLRNEDDAKDVVQNVFVNIWLRREQMMVNNAAEPYLYTMLRNEMLKGISRSIKDRSRQQEMETLLQPELEQLLTPMQKEIIFNHIDGLVNDLPDRMQQVYRLSHEEQLGVREIASRLELSEQTVRNHLNAALKKLRFGLKEALLLILLADLV